MEWPDGDKEGSSPTDAPALIVSSHSKLLPPLESEPQQQEDVEHVSTRQRASTMPSQVQTRQLMAPPEKEETRESWWQVNMQQPSVLLEGIQQAMPGGNQQSGWAGQVSRDDDFIVFVSRA
jgi:hypothetical protein